MSDASTEAGDLAKSSLPSDGNGALMESKGEPTPFMKEVNVPEELNGDSKENQDVNSRDVVPMPVEQNEESVEDKDVSVTPCAEPEEAQADDHVATIANDVGEATPLTEPEEEPIEDHVVAINDDDVKFLPDIPGSENIAQTEVDLHLTHSELNGQLAGGADEVTATDDGEEGDRVVESGAETEDLNGPGYRRYSYGEALDNHDLDTMYGDSVPDDVRDARERWSRGGNRRSSRLERLDSMKVLLPYRRRSRRTERQESPIDSSGLISTLLLTWMTPLFSKAYRGESLRESDMAHLRSHKETAQSAATRLEELWGDELRRKGPTDASLARVLFKHIRTRFIAAAIIQFIATASNFLLGPYIFYSLVTHLNKPEPDVWYAICLALSLSLSFMVRAFGVHFGWYLSVRTAGRVRSAVLMMLYTKLSRLRSTAEISVGEVVNIVVNDCTRLFEAVHLSAFFSIVPALTVLLFAGSLFLVGASALAGIAAILIFYLMQICIGGLIARYRQTGVEITDKRVRLMNELLTCVKLIKMYAWEDPFANTIADIRKSEERVLRSSGYLQAITTSVAFIIAPGGTLVTIVVHILTGNSLTAAQAFTLMCLFMGLTVCLYAIPATLKPMVEAKIGVQRIKSIILLNEVTERVIAPKDTSLAITFTDATLSWDEPKSGRKDAKSAPAGDLELDDPDADNANTIQKDDIGAQDKEEDAQLADKLLDGFEVINTPPCTLQNIDLSVPKGKLIGICGSIGSGKSSLLSAILKQMYTVSGSIERAGSIAYASQQAWIMNATVRQNIVFNYPFDSRKYHRAVFACSLEPDFKIMTNGDQTEIGERGTNMSGGQKQRISLARVLYSESDIYLLDDPLSAVDAHVGMHIFTHCIKDAMKGKTTLFVTHQLQYLKDCDHILLMKDGRIAETGTHEELLREKGEYARLINTYHADDEGEDDEEEVGERKDQTQRELEPGTKTKHGLAEANATHAPIKGNAESAKLIEEEEMTTGVVLTATYRSYVTYSGGWCSVICALFCIVLGNIFLVGTNAWLAIWLRAADMQQPDVDVSVFYGNESSMYEDVTELPYDNLELDLSNNLYFYVGVYSGLFVAVILMFILSSHTYVNVVLRAATSLHNSVFRKVIESPMSFFDTTPLGRILNRFSKDMDEVDLDLPNRLLLLASLLIFVVLGQIGACVFLPWNILPTCVLFPACLFVLRYFRWGFCDIKRLDNLCRSRLVSHLSASIQGHATIQAFCKSPYFIRRFESLLDSNTQLLETVQMAIRWAAVRLDSLAALNAGVVAIIVILWRDQMSNSVMAFVLYIVSNLCVGTIQTMFIAATETESSFIGVERMLEYIEKLDPEGEKTIPDTKPGEKWPHQGHVQFQGVKMRYRPNLPLVLKDVSLDIQPRHKIGIVGRTGSGKSSLGVCLFRLVEMCEGSIIIDGVDIRKIGLHDLRSRLSIIPQDPVLFIGTVRYNLDPFMEHSDDAIWVALEKTHIKQTISNLDGKLEAPVIENGENFSVGERQLICMARALLRNSRVLLLDEATAAIDTHTDSLIQQTIREAFEDCTMLIIAHRLNTVLDCDRILVMDQGEVGEFDLPSNLLANPNSLLSSMVAAAGDRKQSQV